MAAIQSRLPFKAFMAQLMASAMPIQPDSASTCEPASTCDPGPSGQSLGHQSLGHQSQLPLVPGKAIAPVPNENTNLPFCSSSQLLDSNP